MITLNAFRMSAISAAILASSTESLAQRQPVDACGEFKRQSTCVVFLPDTGGVWFYTRQVSSPLVGQRGRVIGFLETGCIAACPSSQGCLENVSVSTECQTQVACRVDFDNSGAVGLQDLFGFLVAFFGGLTGPSPPSADFDQSGGTSVQDIFAFLDAWFAGC
ncbi:MAG: hypothetical protein ACK4WH_01250 [Phycisphaerales bacterium]